MSITKKVKVSRTGAALKSRIHPPRALNEPNALGSVAIPKQWEPTGICFDCRRHLEALQPGGLSVRHIEDQTPICSAKHKGETFK